MTTPSLSRRATLLTAGAATVLAGMLPAAPAHASAAPGQPLNDDYGQSAAEVTAEVNSQVSAYASVKTARALQSAYYLAYTKAASAYNTANNAYQAAVKAKSYTRIKTTSAARTKALTAKSAAYKKYSNQVKATATLVAQTTLAVRSHHYTPVDGTYTSATNHYFIPGVGLEPFQIQIKVYAGTLSDVTVINSDIVAEAANNRTSPSQSYIEGALYTGYPPFCENPNLPVNNVPVLRQAMALTIGQLATLTGVKEGQPTAVAIVSCATFTSGSFTTSLQQALLKAGIHS